MTIRFLGHSAFLVSAEGYSVLMDPFLTGNPLAAVAADELEPDVIALTHGHSDHIGDTRTIAERTGAPVVAAFEICNFLGEQGLERLEPGNPGGTIQVGPAQITFTHAFHSSSYEGRYMGMPCGLIVRLGGKTFYHLGDTGLFGDLKLYGDLYHPDVTAIPIGGRFTMDAALGSRAAELVGAPVTIPMHYRTFPPLAQTADGFEPVEITVAVLEPGEELTVE
ncbi:MAG: metal-dependent hydrolase [Spirochaetaceae bacterium]